ncbi:alpha/beta hydrolase [Streptomyces sp. NPDC094032]|uniref:alpha/beta fold hydrolase n=1 Tax=Streptomyces sp. NPDC094032 TaxID=3155308 RepID=UPI00331FCEC0
MAEVEVNGVRLFYETGGDGDPLVLVHGSWGDHHDWDAVVHAFALRHRVLVYDRRGHSASERPAGPGSRFEDEEDLAALLETLGFAPAFVVGNSFGASLSLGLAARRPELFRALAVHEPPLLDVVADLPEWREEVAATRERIDGVSALLREGDALAAARAFVDTVAFGPGAWERFPQALKDTFVVNAPTFLDEQGDPEWAALDLEGLRRCTAPALLTRGSLSPRWFGGIFERVAGALPGARAHVFEGAGHVPHVTHPQRYVEELTAFFARAE